MYFSMRNEKSLKKLFKMIWKAISKGSKQIPKWQQSHRISKLEIDINSQKKTVYCKDCSWGSIQEIKELNQIFGWFELLIVKTFY